MGNNLSIYRYLKGWYTTDSLNACVRRDDGNQQKKGISIWKKSKRIVAVGLATAMLGAFPVTSFAASASKSGAIGSVTCTGTTSTTNTVATAVTRIFSTGSVSSNVTAYCSGTTMRKTTYGSASDSVAAEARAYNAASTVIVGARGSYYAQYGTGAWSDSNTVGTTW